MKSGPIRPRLAAWAGAALCAVLVISSSGLGSFQRIGTHTPTAKKNLTTQASERVRQSLARLPLSFIENRGQLDNRVSYYLQGADNSAFFTSGGLTYSLTGQAKGPKRPYRWSKQGMISSARDKVAASRYGLKLDFVGANPVVPVASGKTQTSVGYFKGQVNQWKTGLAAYSTLEYRNLWPGIDLVYAGKGQKLKYSFRVKPGADPSDIRLAYRGASSLAVNDKKQLKVSTPGGVVTEDRPFSYQEMDGKKVEVKSSYEIAPPTSARSRPYGFSIGSYDRSKPLVIDPVVLVYAGFVGGLQADRGQGIAVDSSGAAYITGITKSAESTFPDKEGPDQTHNGEEDAFVAKVTPDGKGLVYAGYIGGSGQDWGLDIAVDSLGAAYITGITGRSINSEESDFPHIKGPDLEHNDGEDSSGDAFVAKVAPDGRSLDYAGYIGGAEYDFGRAIAVDGFGAAYVTGESRSGADTFPTEKGPSGQNNGGSDAFVAKVNPAGTALEYAGYIGGKGNFDQGTGIAVDNRGAAYVAGWAASETDPPRFPVKIGPDLTHNGGLDVFVAKVKPDGTALEYAGYIGGPLDEPWLGRARIAVDNQGAAYVTADTPSRPEDGFPVEPGQGPMASHKGGIADAFVAKVKPDGTALEYAGYIGGSGDDAPQDIAVDQSGAAYIVGYTNSTQNAGFPVKEGPDLDFNGQYDAFIAKVNPEGKALEYAGYIGGSRVDAAFGVALDGTGSAYVTGSTYSSERAFPTPFPVKGGPGLTYNGGLDPNTGPPLPVSGFIPSDSGDAFVAKVSVVTAPSAPATLTAAAGNAKVDLAWTPPSSNGGSAVTGYNLYRATASGGQGPTPLATGVATTAYTDLAVQNGVTYYYKVSAVNGAAEGPQSNEAAATPSAPPVSSDLRVLGIDPRSGPVAGGTKVTVSGLGLEGATQINFSGAGVVDRTCGGAAGSGTAPCFAQESPTQITVYSPKAPDAMRAHVSVTTAKGRSEQTDADLFAYVQQAAPGPPPALPTSRGVAAPGTSTPPNLPSTTSPLSSGGLQGPPPLTAPATLNAPVGVPGSAPVQAPVFAQVQAPSPGQVPAASQPAGAVPGAAIDSNREVPAEAPAYKMVGYSKGSPPILHLLLAGAALALGGFAAERRATRSRQICGGCLEPAPIPAPKGAY